MDIEEKLLKFRQQQQQNKSKETEKSGIFGYLKWNRKSPIKDKNEPEIETKPVKNEKKENLLAKRSTANKLLVHEVDNEKDDVPTKTPEEYKLYAIKLLLKCILWLILFALFIKLEFGAVYFVISLLVIIYMNTNVKKKGKISAYSVFNPNLERIQGTFTPEHVEKSIIGTF